MRRFLFSLPVLAAVWAEAPIARAEIPPSFTVRDVHYGGSGCPAGSVAVTVPPSAGTFTLLFTQLSAQAGPGVDAGEARRNCNLTVVFDFPAGWSFSIEGADVRGFAGLEEGVEARLRSTYSFPGAPREARAFDMAFSGEMDDNFTKRDVLAEDLGSPCAGRRNLHIKTEALVDNRGAPSGRGLLTVDSVDGVLRQTYRLRFRRCGR